VQTDGGLVGLDVKLSVSSVVFYQLLSKCASRQLLEYTASVNFRVCETVRVCEPTDGWCFLITTDACLSLSMLWSSFDRAAPHSDWWSHLVTGCVTTTGQYRGGDPDTSCPIQPSPTTSFHYQMVAHNLKKLKLKRKKLAEDINLGLCRYEWSRLGLGIRLVA